MALFSATDASFLPALLHVGFSAQVQSAASGKYVGEGREGACSLVGEADAPLFYIVSRDIASIGEKGFAPRIAMAAAKSPEAQPRFLGLHAEESPAISTSPCAVRVVLPKHVGANSTGQPAFTFKQVLQERKLLSSRQPDGSPVRSGTMSLWGGAVTRQEQFLLQVCGASIGRGPGFVPGEGEHKATSVSDALTFAIFELGIRFRIRSVHGRVLWRIVRDATDSKALSKKRKRKLMVVRQDGPKSNLGEVSEDHVVLEPARRSSQGLAPQNGNDFIYTLSEAGAGGRILTIGAHNLDRGKVLLYESAAILEELSDAEVAEGKNGSMLIIRGSGRGWGSISIGAQHPKSKDSDEKVTEWLMAGPRGRLEVRHHCSAWESFSVELVEQSYNVCLKELPPSNIFADVDSADRSMVRAQIASQVAAARTETERKDLKSRKKQSFNHAAFLSGLGGDPSDSTPSKAFAAGGSSGSGMKAGGESGSKGSVTTTAAESAAAVAVSSKLPRSAMSKKAKQRAKKEKKKNAKKNLASASTGSASLTRTASPGRKPPSSTDSNDNAEPSPATSSSSSESSSSFAGQGPTGPPCAACGRACTGTYTKASGKEYHQTCFGCRTCRRPLLPGTGQFREHNGVPYCNPCYASSIAPHCARCSKPIMDTVTTAMDKTWHKACLTCVICRLPLTETFWLYADKPNEPRCSRCVTGSEERVPGVNYSIRGQRNVNLPGPLFRHGNSDGPTTSAFNGPSLPNTGGRARLTTRTVPNVKR